MHIHARSKAEQSDVQQSEVSESIDSLNSFLECDYECHFEQGFAPSCFRYSAASRLYVLAGERIQIRSQPRHNIDLNILEKSIPKSMKNRSKIDENRFLEPYWLKMTPPWSHLGPRWPRGLSFYRFLTDFGEPKIHSKMKQFSDTHWNLVFCAWSLQTLQNEGAKQLPNGAFSAQGQNPKIVLSPKRGLSLRGLKQSKIISFFRTICVSPGHGALVPLFSRFVGICERNGSPKSI